jgi:hypothetical protein
MSPPRSPSLSSAPGDDQGDVVVLFVRAELPHLVDDRLEYGLGRQLTTSPQPVDEALLSNSSSRSLNDSVTPSVWSTNRSPA